ncbi:MAG: protein-glutamate O-methyltransferase CheR [Magnetococcales bacterium]|nr:protein-glutamate O-methyltransferase CheR [Magnetococcales bacterium]
MRNLIHDQSGILLGPGKEYLVENRLTVIMLQNGCDNFKQLHRKLVEDTGPLRAKVIDAMTTNETLWFRDSTFVSALTDFVVPNLLEKARKQGKVRIWSAACSTGQEPYSMAMLLEDGARRISNPPPPDRFEILATDISPSSIFIASSGRYSQLAISRGMREPFLERYFTKKGMVYEVNPEIRSRVTFKNFNLKDSFVPHGRFDFIMIRNVMIYFADDLKRELYTKLRQSLLPDGFLTIGASESPRGYTSDFEQVLVGGSALYRPIGSSEATNPAFLASSTAKTSR